MSRESDDSEALEEQFPLWLAAMDEALAAAGTEAAALPEQGVPGELRPRLEREGAWCRFVRELWPHVYAGDLPSTLSASPAAADEPTAVLPLARLGRFELRRELGRGAFGVVFLAHDPQLGRDVALKVPRAEVLVTPELRARFQQEARAAAALDHPNLVPVYDAGEQDSICYIASAYCPGTTLAAWLRERTEPVPVRLAARLLAVLARAVEHAHQRGVLHRDLKPSNVMLETPAGGTRAGPGEDGLGFIPRVMDFGLAKLSAAATEGTGPDCQTHTGAILGTARYMAPEQAEGQSKTLGPAADVYALGAILYELLSGRPPIVGETNLATLQLVRSQDPLPPGRLRPGLPRDLETICLHCLHKEPGKRYLSAQALAEDLERFLAGEPVRARPTAAWERALKWARRRPAVAALAGVGTLALGVIVLVVLVANVQLRRQRDYAQAKQQQALVNLRKARDAVDRMLTRVAQEQLRDMPRMEPVQRQLLEDAVEFYQDLVRQNADDPETRYETGRAHRRLGNLYRWRHQLERAESSQREGLALLERLVAESPTVPAYRQELAGTYHDLGQVLGEFRRNDAAEEAFRKALALQGQLVSENPDEPAYRADLAVTWGLVALLRDQQGQPREELHALRQSLELLDGLVARYPAVLDYRLKRTMARNNLAARLHDDGRLPEAEAMHRENLAVWEELAAGDPAVVLYRSRLSLTLSNLGDVLKDTGRAGEAEQVVRRAIKLTEALARDFPDAPHYRYALANRLYVLAALHADRGEHAEARRLLEQVIASQREALRLGPGTPAYLEGLRNGYSELADILLKLGDHHAAAQAATELPALLPDRGRGDYDAARLLSRCVPLAENDPQLSAAQRAELATGYTSRAIQSLRQAIQKGQPDVAALGKDPAFAALRSRSDFQQLLSDAARKP
jgi:tetratricopeptide (TPR) repeat protein/tRNA A-37 threonylcarbamoyl transferase component Bud32